MQRSFEPRPELLIYKLIRNHNKPELSKRPRGIHQRTFNPNSSWTISATSCRSAKSMLVAFAELALAKHNRQQLYTSRPIVAGSSSRTHTG